MVAAQYAVCDNGEPVVWCTKMIECDAMWCDVMCVCDANNAINFWNCLHNMHHGQGGRGKKPNKSK